MRNLSEISRDIVIAERALENHGYTNVANLSLDELIDVEVMGTELRAKVLGFRKERDEWIAAAAHDQARAMGLKTPPIDNHSEQTP